MVYKYIYQLAIDFLFPPRCVITDQAITKHANNRFLSATAQGFLPLLHIYCPRCSLPLSTPSKSACGECQKHPPQYKRVISPLIYAEPIRSMIQDTKFNNILHNAAFFADLLLKNIQQHYQHQALPQLILPVPLHNKRLQQRGYNQAREISRLLSQQLSISHNDQSLIRIKATDEQSGLNAKQRQHNLKNAFAVAQSLLPIKHVAIVDDVMTTGATVNSVAQTLLDEGVEQVDVWVVARTAK